MTEHSPNDLFSASAWRRVGAAFQAVWKGLFAVFAGFLATAHQSSAHDLDETLHHCLTGDASVERMMEDLELSGWSHIPHGSAGLDSFAFHTATVMFWSEVRDGASETTWSDTFRIQNAQIRREVERDLRSINSVPFVSDLGGDNYLLLEHYSVAGRAESWTCTIVLSSDLALSQSAEVGRLRTITKSFGQYGANFQSSTVMRAEVGGLRVGEMMVGRLDPELLADAIDDERVNARSFYSIYSNNWMLNFIPTQ